MADENDLTIEIIEQPHGTSHRFRYIDDKFKNSVIAGVGTTETDESYPKIRIAGLKTPAKIRVSCVTADTPYRVHPNELTRPTDQSWNGIIEGLIMPPSEIYELNRVSVIFTKRRDIEEAIQRRRALRVDPFNQGFDHGIAWGSGKTIRLCFEAHILDGRDLRSVRTLTPVVSDKLIHTQDSPSRPEIIRFEPEMVPMTGGVELKIFGNRNWSFNNRVKFSHIKQNLQLWEVVVVPTWRQPGENRFITVISPPYIEPNCTHPIDVIVQCVNIVTKQKSTRKFITFYPLQTRKETLSALPAKHLTSESPTNQLQVPVGDGTSISVPSSPATSTNLPGRQLSTPSSLDRTIQRRKKILRKLSRANIKKLLFGAKSLVNSQPEQSNDPSNNPSSNLTTYSEQRPRLLLPRSYGLSLGPQPRAILPSDSRVPPTVRVQPPSDEEPLPGPSGVRSGTTTEPFYSESDEDMEE